jgi:hypothetical protein
MLLRNSITFLSNYQTNEGNSLREIVSGAKESIGVTLGLYSVGWWDSR